jgi:hypothetical protein
MKHEPYANTDPSLHFNTVEPVDDSWRNEYLALLTDRDYEAAHELRLQNDLKYREETEPVVTVVKAEPPPLLSCREVEMEQSETEWEAANV